MCSDAAVGNARSLVVTRRFQSVPPAVASGKEQRCWMDAPGSDRTERVNTLKNVISTRLTQQQRLLPFLVDLRAQVLAFILESLK